eukprot:symbB.v1.2.029661.t1/scaffold3276.1/size59877/7
MQFPERSCCSLFKSVDDWTNETRLPCVHSLSNSVRQGPVCSSSMMFSMFSLARAPYRGSREVEWRNSMEIFVFLCPGDSSHSILGFDAFVTEIEVSVNADQCERLQRSSSTLRNSHEDCRGCWSISSRCVLLVLKSTAAAMWGTRPNMELFCPPRHGPPHWFELTISREANAKRRPEMMQDFIASQVISAYRPDQDPQLDAFSMAVDAGNTAEAAKVSFL